MTTNRTSKPYPAELRERAVRLVQEHEAEHASLAAAIRLPANQMLQRRISYLLTRPVGRPPKKPVVTFTSFQYQARG